MYSIATTFPIFLHTVPQLLFTTYNSKPAISKKIIKNGVLQHHISKKNLTFVRDCNLSLEQLLKL